MILGFFAFYTTGLNFTKYFSFYSVGEKLKTYSFLNSWTISKDEIIKYVEENYSKELKKEGFPKKLANGKLDYKYYTLNPDGSIDVELTLYFKPQSYFYIGLAISGTTFVILVGYLGFDVVRNRRRKDKNQTE